MWQQVGYTVWCLVLLICEVGFCVWGIKRICTANRGVALLAVFVGLISFIGTVWIIAIRLLPLPLLKWQ
jgi:uncharacterized membrane protein (DUF4010 family)